MSDKKCPYNIFDDKYIIKFMNALPALLNITIALLLLYFGLHVLMCIFLVLVLMGGVM